MRRAAVLVQLLVIVLSLSGCGCGLVCHPGSTVTCPDGAFVGESVEAILTLGSSTDFSFEWSVSGDVELIGEMTETLEITPAGPGVITVTVTLTDERTGDSATASCEFNAVEESDPRSRGL